eukprot:1373410-Prymnesium_polylepis.1
MAAGGGDHQLLRRPAQSPSLLLPQEFIEAEQRRAAPAPHAIQGLAQVLATPAAPGLLACECGGT